ncbi:MAG: PTS sugar transporter subunit IIB [Clostridiales bacterium]|uniref:PTS sugar transporter subunit IIB n=1 Tax=Clostridium isatidis TaxID=182773 RepID=A0A343JA46_9CLOT|nr:PTS sugar transporter subunit IIB [Clostridium isatidis]ASW42404.1 PTS sugar transporter subunit IIB [Clostridium isatidis]NLZ48441.1 PTS sugar transporter subunit IIB [Clostridiales bacterium]
MKNILLVCSAGMSTSLLVSKMQRAAKENSLDCNIWAVSQSEAEANWEKADILLLGPQVRFLQSKMKTMVNGKIPIAVIDVLTYGRVDGQAVLNQAIKIIDEFQNTK